MRVLVIGAGSIGKRHHQNLVTLGADARLLPWRQSGGALDTALAETDAVIIATATQIRLPLIRACAERGLPFYVEKPLAYDTAGLAAIMEAAAPVAARSVAGFMMRYHPAIRHLADSDLSDIFRFGFEIGHDVTQWRQNWRFSDSYAALPEGGGVLLDLCHELDMAACLFPGLALGAVESLGHAAYPGVDVATQIGLSQSGRTGSVAMDYLLPVSTRRITLRGTERLYDLDLIAGRYSITGKNPMAPEFPFERNEMFLGLMQDFLALAAGRTPSDNPLLPGLDRVGESCGLIARAWESRRFAGQITKQIP